jgi:hypothetical protein
MTFAESKWAPLVDYASRSGPIRVGGTARDADAEAGRGGSPARGINVRVSRRQSDTLVLQYVLMAEMPGIRVPFAPSPGRADGLWKHTCFEAFIAIAGTPGYCELNFSPSQQWALYRFSGYRERMSPTDVTVPPELNVRCFDDRLELDAVVRLPELIALEAGRTLKLALTAVVEDDSGTLSYWALKHAPGKPDFHHPDGFVLELTP